MKKKEIIFVSVILLLAAVSYFAFQYFYQPQSEYGQVLYQDKVLLEFDINEDHVYDFDGTYGHMQLEVKDGSWRIINEECPNHVCSSVGWVSIKSFYPILCIPNEVLVVIKE